MGVFEKYVKERAEEERRERRNKLKTIRDGFQSLLEEAALTTKSTFSEFSTKYAKEDRFKGVEKLRDRETYFQDFIADLRKKEKEEKAKEKEQQLNGFTELLQSEKAGVDRHSRWSEVKKVIETDERFIAVESATRREDWFKDHVRDLEREYKLKEREKEREREREKEKERREKREKSREREKKDRKRDRSRSKSPSSSKKDRDRSPRDKSRDKSPRKDDKEHRKDDRDRKDRSRDRS